MRKLTPLKAIRAKCIDCCNNNPKEATLCSGTDCPLHPYRLGKNPNRKGVGVHSNIRNRSVIAKMIQDAAPAEIGEKHRTQHSTNAEEKHLETTPRQGSSKEEVTDECY